MSDSVRLHRRQPTRLPRPWDSPGKNTGVGCHFLLQCMKVKSENEVTQSCLTLHNPMDCSLQGSSMHGIFQARVLEWDAIAFSEILLYWLVKYALPRDHWVTALLPMFTTCSPAFLFSGDIQDCPLDCTICWYITVHNNFLWLFYFCHHRFNLYEFLIL